MSWISSLFLPRRIQNQIQRALKVLHLLGPGVDHLFQFEYGIFQNPVTSSKKGMKQRFVYAVDRIAQISCRPGPAKLSASRIRMPYRS